MNGLLLVALCGISLMSLLVSPCGAAPYYDTDLHNPYQLREHLAGRPQEGRQMSGLLNAEAALRHAMMRDRMKKEVDYASMDDKKRSLDYADNLAPIENMPNDALYTDE